MAINKTALLNSAYSGAKQGASIIGQITSKNSVTRLVKDQIFQFPVIMDADIDDDEKFPIIKSLEKNYASIMMMAITNEGSVDRTKFANINEFLRHYHNNGDSVLTDSDFPNTRDQFKKNISDSVASVNPIPMADRSPSEESLTVTEAIVTEGTGYISDAELKALWGTVEESLDMESLNSMYLPYKTTMAKMTRAIEAAKGSTEPEVYFMRDVTNGTPAGMKLKSTKSVVASDGSAQHEYIRAKKDSSDYKKMVELYGEPKTMGEWSLINGKNSTMSRISGDMMPDNKFSVMSPTLLKLNLANHNEYTSWGQQLIIGIKAMARFIPQSLMISNMIDAFKNRSIFNFIKWTKGELKWWDILFDVTGARAAAKANSRWLGLLRKRARKNDMIKTLSFGKRSLNPNATIIITEADAQMIMDRCGVDPHSPANITKVMDKYFLLGFGIYDTEAKMLSMIYDGDSDYTTNSLRTLMTEAKKDVNLLAMNKY